MSKIKMTQGELKRQRDGLGQFRRYLPTLQLKKQQLQMRIRESQKTFKEKEKELLDIQKSVEAWAGLLAEPIPVEDWCLPRDIRLGTNNVAGVRLPVLEEVVFAEARYDLYETPIWVDRAIEELRRLITILAQVSVVREQVRRLREELRVTTQRVNLFEKVKIPECLDNIRVIRIYLGDQMANAVGIGKVAKKKLDLVAAIEV